MNSIVDDLKDLRVVKASRIVIGWAATANERSVGQPVTIIDQVLLTTEIEQGRTLPHHTR